MVCPLMAKYPVSSELIQYLLSSQGCECENNHIPSLQELSKELGVSVARLREQLEVAKAMGLVETRPRTGIRRLPYSFYPAIRQSLSYSIHLDPAHFTAFSDLRNHLESAYWEQAVRKLTPQDTDDLNHLVARAREKLNGKPIQIPHAEHRQLHLKLFCRLDNPFVSGILEAYWEAYEEVGLNLYADYHYLQQVWNYHQKMVDAICAGDYTTGYQALLEHMNLLDDRPNAEVNLKG